MLILPKLEVPLLPLTTGTSKDDLASVISYLHSLIGYFYDCNAPLADTILGEGEGSAQYNEGSFTINTTGFAPTAPSGTATYVQVGKQTTVILPPIQGISNATTFTVTGIPATLVSGVSCFAKIPTFDNNIHVDGMILIASATTTWTVYTNNFAAGWTATGLRGFQGCTVTYISI